MNLEDFLLNNPYNRNNLEELKRTFDRDFFIPFVGAGPSTLLGAPSWKELVKAICNYFNINVRIVKYKNGKINYPKIFQNIYNKLSAKDKKIFYSAIFENIKPTQTQLTNFHIQLVDLFDTYITTNYDLPIELAFKEKKGKILNKHYFSCYDFESLKDSIIYLHGHQDINFCIIKEEDYKYFYPTISKKNGIPIIEDFLLKIFTKKRLIFVGFSFDDKYISDYLKMIETKNNCHFWLVNENTDIIKEIMSKVEEYRRSGLEFDANEFLARFFRGEVLVKNIKPIVYKDNYNIFIEYLFEELRVTSQKSLSWGNINGQPVR